MPRKKYRPVHMRELTTVSRVSWGHPTKASYRRAFTFNSGPSSRERRSQHLLTPEDAAFGPLPSTVAPAYTQASLDQFELKLTQASLESEPRHLYPSFGDPPPCIFLESDFPPLPASYCESVVGNSRKQQRRSVTLPEPLLGVGSEVPHQRPWSWASRSERPASPESTTSGLGAVVHRTVSEPCPDETKWPSAELPDCFARSVQVDSALDVEEPVVYTARYAMASAYPQMSGDARRHFSSGPNRYENRAPVGRPTTCKNGPLCRKYQEGLHVESLSL